MLEAETLDLKEKKNEEIARVAEDADVPRWLKMWMCLVPPPALLGTSAPWICAGDCVNSCGQNLPENKAVS